MVALDPFAPSGWPLNKPPQSGHSSGCHLFPATTVQFLSTERPPLWLSPTVAGHSWGEKPSPPAPVCSLPQLAGLPSCLAIWSRDKAWSTLISKHDVVIKASLQILFYLHLFVWLLLVLSLTSVRTSSLLLSPFHHGYCLLQDVLYVSLLLPTKQLQFVLHTALNFSSW